MPWSHKRCHIMVGKVNMLLEDTDDWPRIVARARARARTKPWAAASWRIWQWLLVSLNTAEEGVARCESPERMFR